MLNSSILVGTLWNSIGNYSGFDVIAMRSVAGSGDCKVCTGPKEQPPTMQIIGLLAKRILSRGTLSWNESWVYL